MTTSLVTGGAGFLGSHSCDELLRRGNRVICVDTSRPDRSTTSLTSATYGPRMRLSWKPVVELRDGLIRTIAAMGVEKLVGAPTA